MSGCEKKQATDRSLRIHLPNVKLNLDPQKMEDAYSMAVVTQIYRGLLRYDTAGAVLSDLSESWTEAPDHLSYRFKLKTAKFSDGSPITATNVQMSFARMFLLGASMAADIDYITGSSKFKTTKDLSQFGVKAISSDTVEFRLDRPCAIFLKQIAVADCSILPITDFHQDPNISTAGGFSGPYKIGKNFENGSLEIQKWRTDALDSSLPPEHVTYFTTDKKPIDLALSGQTDTLDHDRVEISEKKNLESKGWATTPSELAGEIFVVLNPQTISEQVRHIMYSSVDPIEPLAVLNRSTFRPAYGLIPFGQQGELSADDVKDLKTPPENKEKIKASIQLDYEKSSDLEEKTAQFLKVKWAKLGIEITLNPLSKGEKLQRLFGKKSQAILARKAMDYPDGFSVLGYFKGNYESNYFFVNDPKIDQALAEVLQTFDSAKRAEKYKAIQRDILKEHTLIPLFFGSDASGLWSDKVKSVPAHPLGYHTLPLESVQMNR